MSDNPLLSAWAEQNAGRPLSGNPLIDAYDDQQDANTGYRSDAFRRENPSRTIDRAGADTSKQRRDAWIRRERAKPIETDSELGRAGVKFWQRIKGLGAGGGRLLETTLESYGLDPNGDAAQWLKNKAAAGEAYAARPVAGEQTWEELKAKPTVGGLARFVLENGASSLADMGVLASGAGIIPYVGMQAGSTGQQRAENNADETADATGTDVLKGLPSAAASAWLERLGLHGIFGASARSVTGRIAQAFGAEAVTEALQSPIEYAGSNLGTDAGFDPMEALDQAAAGVVAGGFTGGVMRAVGEGVDAAARPRAAAPIDPDAPALPSPNAPAGPAPAAPSAAPVGEAYVDPRTGSPRKFATQKQAAVWMAANKQGHLWNITPQDDGTFTLSRNQNVDVPDEAVLTPQDRASPIPNDVIAAGRRAAGAALDPAAAAAKADAFIADPVNAEAPTPEEAIAALQAQRAPDRGDRAVARAPAGLFEQPAAPAADFVAQTARVESGGDVTARNPNSSAAGAHQFVKRTWLGLMRKYRAKQTASMSDEQVLALRDNPIVSAQMAGIYANENAKALTKGGNAVDNGSLYLAHFLGAGGANAVLSAAPNTPVEQLLSAGQIAANKSVLAGKTAAQVKAWAYSKMKAEPGDAAALPTTADPAQYERETVSEFMSRVLGEEDTDGTGLEQAEESDDTASAPVADTPPAASASEGAEARSVSPPATPPADLYDRAREIVTSTNNGSTSHLARKLGVPQSEATTLLDRMQQAGIVSAVNKSGGRDVVVQDAAKPPVQDRSVAIVMDPAKGTTTTVPVGNQPRAPKLIEGQTVKLSADISYASAGEDYTVERVDKSGRVYLRNARTGGGTSLAPYELQNAAKAGVTFDVKDAPVTIEDMPSGKSIIIKGATDAQIAAIRAAIPPKAQPLTPKSGGVVYSAKYRPQIEAALDSLTQKDTPSADGNSSAQRNPGTSGLEGNEGALPEPQSGGVREIRREGDRGASEVDGGLLGVPGRDRPTPDAEAQRRPDRQQQGVRAGERAVGDGDRAEPEQAGMDRRIDVQRQDDADERLGQGTRDQGADLGISSESGLANRENSSAAQEPSREARSDADARRANNATPNVGGGSGNAEGNAGRSAAAGVDAGKGSGGASVRRGADNKFFTAEAAEKARATLRAKMSQLNSGFDPEAAAAGLTLMGFHIEAGARSFVAAAKAVAADFGVSPSSLKSSLRSWYNSARDWFEDNGVSTDGMSDAASVRALIDSVEEWGGAQESTDGLQGTVPPSDAGSGSRDVQPAEPDERARPVRAEAERGSARAVRGTDEGRGADPERGGDRPAGSTERRAPSAKPDAGVPGPANGRPATSVVAVANHVIEPGSLSEARGPKTKARDNIAAIELVKKLAAEGRPATRDEQAVLARYVGWGGLKNVFPDGQGAYGKGFEDIGKHLKELLTADEYDTARRSIQYAHYTSETIVREMWRGAQALGFKGGTVFEPGMGTGNFLGMMPRALAGSTRYTGVEMDGITSALARALYPQAGVSQADYTRYEAPRDAFDLVIGNPPFGDITIKADPAYRQGFLIHDYFFAKSLDSVKPGGLLMFVTSAGTMNKLNAKAREYLAERADLVGAIRLPGDAFEENAGTSVTTDIVVLRKRAAGDPAGDASWTETTALQLPNRDGVMRDGQISRYFAENPDQVLGEQGYFDMLVAGERYAVRRERGDNQPFGEKLAAAMDRIANRTVTDTAPPAIAPADIDFGSDEKKSGTFYIGPNGALYQQQGSVGRPVAGRMKGEKGGISAGDQEKVKQLIPIRDALRSIYRADLGRNTAAADKARAELNSAYDAFVAKHGPINKGVFTRRKPSRVQIESARRKAREEARARGFEWEDGTFDAERMFDEGATVAQVAAARELAREEYARRGDVWNEGTFDPADVPDTIIEKRPNIDAFMDDPESYRLRSIEHYNDATGEAAKGPVFTQNVVGGETAPTIKNAVDALYHTLNLTGRVDLDAIARAADVSPSDVIDQLAGQIFQTPEGVWEPAAKYLSGNIRQKLVAAEAAAERDAAFRPNVDALRAVVPADLGKSDVRATLGMNWIDASYINQFGKEALGLNQFSAAYQPVLAQWVATGDKASAAATSTWGTDRRSATDLIDDALNGKSPKIYDTFRDADGSTVSVLNQEATQAAGDKLIAIKEKFKEWIWSDEARATKLLRRYNDSFNNLVAPEYDGSYLTTPGVSALWGWRPHQTRVIARILQEGNTYMAHAVGAGKTSAMIGAGMEMKRLGLVNKPMYVVPNHMLQQFTKEFYEQYPTARIMVADDDRNFVTDRRKQFISDMALADLDAVIIKHSAFGLIPLSDEFQERMIRQHLDELRETLSAIKADRSGDNRITRARVERQIEQAEQRYRDATGGRKKDQTFTFEETGVDFLFVDEAHLFRKLDFATGRGDVKGIDPNGSMRSMDLFLKTRYLEQRRPGRSHVLASGTAITNTMAELYSISRYLQPETLAERGIDRFDAWASAFGDTVTDLEPTAGGTYKPVTRFSQFVNVPELSAMVRQIMDVVTPEQLEQYVVRPTVRNHMVVVPESEGQAAYRAALQARMTAIENRRGKPKKGDDIMLSVINDGRNAAIDMRLVDPSADEEHTKLMEAIENVARIWKETKRHPFYEVVKGPNGERGAYAEKPSFYAPAAQMVFASRGVGADRKFNVHRFMVDELAKRGVPRSEMVIFNSLKNDVAKQRVFNDMKEGKVRILFGSVDKMGTGVNAQRLLAANHNMDPEWLPSSDEQRNGRIIRQGNLNKSVDIYNYSTKGTYDSAMWGMMARKAKFIEGFFRGDPTLRDMEDLGEASKYEQAKALTTRDPRILVLTEAKQELEKELRRRSAYESDIANARSEAANSIRWAERLEKSIVHEKADVAQAQDIAGDAFRARVGDQEFTERAAFQKALDAAMEPGDREAVEAIGEIGGFDLARSTFPVTDFEDGRKRVTMKSELVLLLNGDDTAGERRYKKLAKTSAAASAGDFLRKLPATVAETQARIDAQRERAAQFAERGANTAPYQGEARIAELEEQVASIEKELKDETAAAEAAKRGAEQQKAEQGGKPQYSLMSVNEQSSALADAGETVAASGDVTARLTERLKALGISDRVTLNVVARIEENPKAIGSYWQRVVTVATANTTANMDAPFVLDHEAIHAMKELGLFRPAEWTALEKAVLADDKLMGDIRRRYVPYNLSEADLIEEAIADRFAQWRKGREEPGFIRAAFQRIADLLDALRRLFGGGPTGGGTLRDIESGAIGRRGGAQSTNPTPKNAVVYHGTPKDFDEFDPDYGDQWFSASRGTAEDFALDRAGMEPWRRLQYDGDLWIHQADTEGANIKVVDVMAEARATARQIGVDEPQDWEEAGELLQWASAQRDWIEEARDEGYDAIEFQNVGDTPSKRSSSHYVLLKPGKFKSLGRAKFSIPSPSGGTSPNPGVVAGLQLGIAKLIGNGSNISERIDDWRTALQDRMLPLLRTQQRLELQTGATLPEELNPYLAEELMSGKVGARLERLQAELVQPLFDAIAAENLTVVEVESFLYARHAPERNERISEINPAFAPGEGSGMTDAEAQAIMDAVDAEGKRAPLERVARRVDDLLKFAVQTRVDAGLLSQNEADAWALNYEHYVPLRGKAELDPEADAGERPRRGSGINVRGKESRRAFGRESKAADILAYSLLQAEEAIIRAGTNEVGQAFYRLAQANPDLDFWKTNKVTSKPVIDKNTGMVTYAMNRMMTREDEPYTVSLKIDGKERRVTMNKANPAAVRLAEAMRNMNATQMDGFTLMLSKTNRWLSAANTTFNPEFVITNAFRDIQTAAGNLQGVDVPGITRGTLKDYRKALIGSVKGSFKRGSGEWARWYEEFVDNGGRVFFNNVEDLGAIRRRIDAQFRETNSAGAALKAVLTLGRYVDQLNTGVENAIRLSAYKNARERGVSPAQAASIAKNLTVNFNRRGNKATLMNALYLFYNASVQGTARLMLGLKSKGVRRVAYAAVALGAALELLNAMLSDDDDDGESFYDKISDFDKERNLILMIPGGEGSYVKVPLPYGYNVFYAIGRAPVEMLRGKKWTESAASLVGTIADAFNPVGGTNSLLNFLSPTIVDPVVDLTRNRDFADRPIMPDEKSFGPKTPDNQRYWSSVNPAWRVVASGLNAASGGDEVVPGAVDVSPETMEYLFSVATGAAGNFYSSKVAGTPIKLITGEPVEADDFMLARKLVGKKPGWVDKSRFYERVAEVEQLVDYGKKYDDRDPDSRAAFDAANERALSLAPAVKASRKQMTAIHKERRNLEARQERGQIDRADYRTERDRIAEREQMVVTDLNREWNRAMER